jgi:predicted Zn-dependent protease
MLTQPQAASIFERIRTLSTLGELEVSFSGGSSSLTRFANNVIHQNMTEESTSVSIRVAIDGRTARSTTNRLDEESLKRALTAAESLAKVQEPDPDLLPMPENGGAPASVTTKAPSRHFAATAALTPQDRAQGVEAIVNIAKKHNLTTAGIYSSAEGFEGIFNSRGLTDWHTQTLAEISITMLGDNSSGWQKLNSPDVTRLDLQALAETAARKAAESVNPLDLPPGKYTVILEPAAVLDIVGFMFWDFGGLSLLDQRSFLCDRVGTKLFGENINIWDNAAHPLQAGPPFDGEGMRRQPVQLVAKGVIHQLVHARATAANIAKSNIATQVGPVFPTGHGFSLPNEMGEMPSNIVFADPANPQTIDQMIASTERGILVTRLWYIREVEPFEKLLTGMTRDGTFLVENGKIQRGIRNFRFNESLIHMLSNVEAMSLPARACGEESFDMVVPAMKVRDFNFTETTKF